MPKGLVWNHLQNAIALRAGISDKYLALCNKSNVENQRSRQLSAHPIGNGQIFPHSPLEYELVIYATSNIEFYAEERDGAWV